MRRWHALLVLLLLASGCATTGEKRWYDEALKDARGENMEMRSSKFALRPED